MEALKEVTVYTSVENFKERTHNLTVDGFDNWYKEMNDVIPLTKEELVKIIGEAWEAATQKEHTRDQYLHYEDTSDEKYRSLPGKDTFINSLFK